MIDRIKFQPHIVYLSDDAVRRSSTIDGFARMHCIENRKEGAIVLLKFKIDDYPVMRVTGIKVRDGRWRVRWVEANLPGLINGHNAVPLKDASDLCLSLTRLRHIVGLLIEPDALSRVIPGIGASNCGWLQLVECFRQVEDKDRRILVASHFARLSHQARPTGVFFRQSSMFRTRNLGLSIYDKTAQMGFGANVGTDDPAIRVEAIYRNGESLAEAVKKTGLHVGRSGPLVTTLAPSTALALLDLALSRLSGFGWRRDARSPSGLSKQSRIILAALGDDIHEPFMLDAALERYFKTARPGLVTGQTVEKELRAYAASSYLGLGEEEASDLIKSLPVAEVRWTVRESKCEVVMREIAAPDEPAADILAAWAQTTFLARVPEPGEMFGSVGFGPSPFRRNTL